MSVYHMMINHARMPCLLGKLYKLEKKVTTTHSPSYIMPVFSTAPAAKNVMPQLQPKHYLISLELRAGSEAVKVQEHKHCIKSPQDLEPKKRTSLQDSTTTGTTVRYARLVRMCLLFWRTSEVTGHYPGQH